MKVPKFCVAVLAMILVSSPMYGQFTGGASTVGGTVAGPTDSQAWFLVMGDSNAAGQSSQTIVDTTPYDSRLYSYVYTMNDALSYLNDSIWHNCGACKSAWPTLAGEWMEKRNEPISIIMAAYGGTNIEQNQNHAVALDDYIDQDCVQGFVPRANTVPGSEGQFYCWAKAQYEEALALKWLRPQQLKAILLILGSGDASFCNAHADVEAKVEEFASGVLRDFGKPVVVAPIGDQADWVAVAGKNAACLAAVNLAMDHAITDHSNIFAGPNLDDLDHSVDGIHIEEMDTLGKRWYTVLNALFP